MILDIAEIKVKTKLFADEKYPDVVATGSLTFVSRDGRSISFSGFNIRKSKFNTGTFYMTGPSNKMFQFSRADKSLWSEIEKEMVGEYEWNSIPTINDNIVSQ